MRLSPTDDRDRPLCARLPSTGQEISPGADVRCLLLALGLRTRGARKRLLNQRNGIAVRLVVDVTAIT